jgi:hypothetical protein
MRNEMESSKEKIEAQLCAYVEGELDDAQRAEIEQHLAANPHHQALIAELRAASGLLRDLPRVKAPIELNESLCGQLERSALLDPTDDDFDPTRSVNRWPQFTAVAAVLLLATGLAFVVYYVLPPSGGNGHTQVAVEDKGLKHNAPVVDAPLSDRGREAGKDQSGDRVALSEKLERSKMYGAAVSPSEGVTHPAASTVPTQLNALVQGVHPKNAPDDLNVARLQGTQERGLVTAAEVENVRKWMNASLGVDNTFFKQGGGNSLYLVVSTNNTTAANGQLAAYFKTNGIQYMEDDTRVAALGAGALADARDVKSEPVVRDLSAKTDTPAEDKGADSKAIASNRFAAGFGAAKGGLSAAPAGRARTFQAGGGAQESEHPAPAPRPAEPGKESTELGRKAEEQVRAGEVAQRKSDSQQTDALSPPVTGKPDRASGTRGDAEKPVDAKVSKAESALGQVVTQHDSAQPMVIVARMNRRQVNELSATLSKQEGQHAQLKEFAPTVVEESLKQATAGAVVTLRPTPSKQASVAPVDSGALTLDYDATKDVSKTGAPPAAPVVGSGGNGARVLRAEIGKPAAGPAEGGRVDSAAATPFSNGATTAPAPLATGADALHLSIDPLDEPVDVVIVLKKEATVAPTTAPNPQAP